ncbi:MAG TPA: NUDIX hydrolase [Actinomycetota bacterium]|nr:NUDIX hydrolase [Actinomycetota bacterium]
MRFRWHAPVQAAGGVVLRRLDGGPVEVALIHRPAYDDWTLPKGKLNPGETHEEAALREVEEETGLVCHLGDPAGQVDYRDRKGRPKVVRYWTMQPVGPSDEQFAPNREVDLLRWIPLAEAGPALTYAHDRQILRSVKPEL